jgi:dTDP-4-amino-4,6-dideoxygalactose transaminase
MASKTWIKKYEQAFASRVDAVGARAFGLGRQALVILLKALGVESGNKIGVCAFTCLSVAEAVKVTGAIPVYLDVDENLCIDPNEILKYPVGSLKTVILQHTFGVPGRLDELLSACERVGASVIEDCAHSFGCYWKGVPLGRFGKGAIYSFQWGKPYTTGQGGILTVNSESLLSEVDKQIQMWAVPPTTKSEYFLSIKRIIFNLVGSSRLQNYLRYAVRRLRASGLVKNPFELPDNFECYKGYIKFMGEMTAKAGLKKINNWDKLEKLRRHNCKAIEEQLKKMGLAIWPKQATSNITMLRYPLLISNKTEILNKAQQMGLDIAGWYNTPVHPLEAAYLEKVNYKNGSCPHAENMISKLVHFPTGYGVNQKIINSMLNVITND